MLKHPDILLTAFEKARALIDTPEKWTKGHSARNVRDERVSIYSKHAVKFCMVGALSLAAHRLDNKNHLELFKELLEVLREAVVLKADTPYTLDFNDHHATHADVMNVFQMIITDLKLALNKKQRKAA